MYLRESGGGEGEDEWGGEGRVRWEGEGRVRWEEMSGSIHRQRQRQLRYRKAKCMRFDGSRAHGCPCSPPALQRFKHFAAGA